MARQVMDNDNMQLHLGMMTKVKQPVIRNLQVDTKPDEKIDDIFTQALPIFAGMTQGIDYTNPNPMNCSSCSYRPVCPSGTQCCDHDGCVVSKRKGQGVERRDA